MVVPSTTPTPPDGPRAGEVPAPAHRWPAPGHTDGVAQVDAQRRFLSAVERLGRALRVVRQQVATEHQLSLLQLHLVEHVATHAPQRVGALATELDVTQPTVSDALEVLTAKGIVERQRDPADGRASIIVLSAEGRTVADAILAALAPMYDLAPPEAGAGAVDAPGTGATGEADLGAALHAVLTEIRRLQQHGVISVNRSCPSPAATTSPPPTTGRPSVCSWANPSTARISGSTAPTTPTRRAEPPPARGVGHGPELPARSGQRVSLARHDHTG